MSLDPSQYTRYSHRLHHTIKNQPNHDIHSGRTHGHTRLLHTHTALSLVSCAHISWSCQSLTLITLGMIAVHAFFPVGATRAGVVSDAATTCGRRRRKNVDRIASRDAHASTAPSNEAEWPSQPRHTSPRVNPEMPKRATHRLAALTRGPDTHTHHSGADSPRHTHAHTLTCSHGFSPVTIAISC